MKKEQRTEEWKVASYRWRVCQISKEFFACDTSVHLLIPAKIMQVTPLFDRKKYGILKIFPIFVHVTNVRKYPHLLHRDL